ncbi:hypothetical protein [Spirochaeta isovalerica]|uniref:Apea-like HEPN domain-containing protein n=1 Tax=Spirochaeta isovalerica TaxID=150 RepID=A0A841RJ05_9SPIO|nr:hypothetical protein [Spirochaeta isovalerica]MBB6482282.1 hypothetical protein [Spirochaeta isovalerica]
MEWVECLLPVYNKDSDDKIVQIINYISPILVHNYISKLLIDLRESLNFSINKVKIKKFLKNKGINTLKDLAELILIRESSDIEELYSLLDSNILLIDRIKYFQGIFKKPTRVKSRLVSHERRLKWQIQRIYRARNLIIHSGKTPYQLETLIENLHYYFDTLMNVCISNLAENDEYKTITDIVNHYSIKKCAYYNFLDSIKKEEINSENISSILSISQI